MVRTRLVFAQTVTYYNWILWAKKLISGILCHGTFEINHGQPWFILNVPWQAMQLIRYVP